MKGLCKSFIFCIIVVLSCETKKEPCPIDLDSQLFAFSIVDSSMNNLLKSDTIYHPDSIVLFNERDTVELTFFRTADSIVEFDLWTILDNEEYYLRLNYEDTDTMRFDLKMDDTKCYPYYIVNVYYNHTEVFPNIFGIFELIK